MRILKRKTITDYIEKHPQTEAALTKWFEETEKAQWNTFEDIKQTFNSVDFVGNQHYVFNINFNQFRLIVVIKFTPKLVFIRFIGTHKEYEQIKDIKNI